MCLHNTKSFRQLQYCCCCCLIIPRPLSLLASISLSLSLSLSSFVGCAVFFAAATPDSCAQRVSQMISRNSSSRIPVNTLQNSITNTTNTQSSPRDWRCLVGASFSSSSLSLSFFFAAAFCAAALAAATETTPSKVSVTKCSMKSPLVGLAAGYRCPRFSH